jgi:4-amino-4-deoxy-L-arabinose transferase-like glycosyltransferase
VSFRTGLGLLLGGAVLRAWWLLVYLSDPSTRFAHGNTGGFVRGTRRILAGDWLMGDQPFFYGPLYSAYLAPFFAWTGDEGLLLPRLVQALLGLVLAVLVWRITRRTFDDAAALGAGALMLCYGPALFFEGLAVATTLSTFLLLLGLDFLSSALDEKGAMGANARSALLLLASGAAFGLCAWGRGNVLLLLPPAALWILWRTHAETGTVFRRLLPAATFTLGATPWSAATGCSW